MLNKTDLDEINQRWQAAKPGFWQAFVEGRDHTSGSSFIKTLVGDIELSGATIADYDFIAHSHQDIPRLLAEIDRLKADDSAVAVLAEIMQWISNWSPNFEQDAEWPATAEKARAVIGEKTK